MRNGEDKCLCLVWTRLTLAENLFAEVLLSYLWVAETKQQECDWIHYPLAIILGFGRRRRSRSTTLVLIACRSTPADGQQCVQGCFKVSGFLFQSTLFRSLWNWVECVIQFSPCCLLTVMTRCKNSNFQSICFNRLLWFPLVFPSQTFPGRAKQTAALHWW